MTWPQPTLVWWRCYNSTVPFTGPCIPSCNSFHYHYSIVTAMIVNKVISMMTILSSQLSQYCHLNVYNIVTIMIAICSIVTTKHYHNKYCHPNDYNSVITHPNDNNIGIIIINKHKFSSSLHFTLLCRNQRFCSPFCHSSTRRRWK